MKSAAALRGMKMKDLILELVERGLPSDPIPQAPGKRGRDGPLPEFPQLAGFVTPLVSNDEALFGELDHDVED
jgi:hypothetical protein